MVGLPKANHSKVTFTMTTQLCRRCQFHPASDRIFGYCSWDCHDADDEHDEQDEPQHEHGEHDAAA